MATAIVLKSRTTRDGPRQVLAHVMRASCAHHVRVCAQFTCKLTARAHDTRVTRQVSPRRGRRVGLNGLGAICFGQ